MVRGLICVIGVGLLLCACQQAERDRTASGYFASESHGDGDFASRTEAGQVGPKTVVATGEVGDVSWKVVVYKSVNGICSRLVWYRAEVTGNQGTCLPQHTGTFPVPVTWSLVDEKTTTDPLPFWAVVGQFDKRSVDRVRVKSRSGFVKPNLLGVVGYDSGSFFVTVFPVADLGGASSFQYLEVMEQMEVRRYKRPGVRYSLPVAPR